MRILAFILILWTAEHPPISNVELAQENTIQNPARLSNFIEALSQLESGTASKVNIVHIGDSHIQADFLTGRTRSLLQNKFGNAGRGFVFPYRIAKSWGPLDVKFKHQGTWTTCNVLRRYQTCNIGASGFTVAANSKSTFSMYLQNEEMEYSFNSVRLFNRNGAFVPSFAQSNFQVSHEQNSTNIQFDNLIDTIVFESSSPQNGFSELQGMVLENGKPGIIYNSMGVNGSAVLQYLRSSFENNIAEMHPDLIIVSFGTNDCYLSASRFCLECTKDRFRNLIQRLKLANPGVDILITTPPDHFWQRSYSSVNIPKLNEALLELADSEEVGIWDLYGIMGRENSIRSWQKESLARRDLIHFTRDGYELQGELLYDALMNLYQQ